MLKRFATTAGRVIRCPPSDPATGAAADHLFLLDAGRGLAAAAVLFWHYQHFFFAIGARRASPDWAELRPLDQWLWPLYEHGDLAVPFFWVISGFVLTFVYVGKPVPTRSFAVNRFARLYPLHLVTLMVVAVLQLVAQARWGTTLIYANDDWRHFMLQLLFASNWVRAGEYSFNAPIWSVSAEILVYAFFWTVHLRLLRHGIIYPAVIAIVSLALWILFPGSPVPRCGYFFFLGCAALSFQSSLRSDPLLLWCAIAAMFMVGIGASLVDWTFLLSAVAYPALAVGVVIALASLEPLVTAGWRKPLRVIGDSTYGLYLWHIPVQLALFLCLSSYWNIARLAVSPFFLGAYLLVVAVVARAGFVAIELPARRRLRQLDRRNAVPDAPISAP
jgi:peptidoglycan/LPS O-acetylase OafA/YrhL